MLKRLGVTVLNKDQKNLLHALLRSNMRIQKKAIRKEIPLRYLTILIHMLKNSLPAYLTIETRFMAK